MKLATIRPNDIVLADIRGSRFYAHVERVEDGECWIEPLVPGLGYHRLAAHAEGRYCESPAMVESEGGRIFDAELGAQTAGATL